MYNKPLFLIAYLVFCNMFTPAKGQYYFQDILNTTRINKDYNTLQNAKIHLIKISSFEDNDQPSDGFFCEKKFNHNYTESTMTSRSYITGESVLTSLYQPAVGIIKSENKTEASVNTTLYEYNEHGEVRLITTITTSPRSKDSIVETREYRYTNHQPEQMIRKKNGTVAAVYSFSTGEKGNVIEEDPVEGEGVKYYYYYDDEGRLTDVVRFNLVAQKLLPDYMFVYSNGDRPSQMISTDETARNYFIWRYAYDQNGLPEIEKCYSREKRLLGTIQYDYQ